MYSNSYYVLACFCFVLPNFLASRMESNGQVGKIQVSENTASKLREAGKSSWLTPRKDLVEAKGKGKMQTYWVEPNKGGKSTEVASNVSSKMLGGAASVLQP